MICFFSRGSDVGLLSSYFISPSHALSSFQVDLILPVAEADILSATALIWSRMKLQIEPSAGVGVAVALGDPLREWLAQQLPNVQTPSSTSTPSSSTSSSGINSSSSLRPFRVGVVRSDKHSYPFDNFEICFALYADFGLYVRRRHCS